MRVLVSGASGLIGSALVRSLRADGVSVQRLVRRAVQQADEVGWDPQAGRGPDPKVVDGVDAVVHLSGAGLGDRFWTTSYKREIRASRVETTRILAETLAGLAAPPRVFLVASAIGWYGDTGDRETDENGPPGSDFLPTSAANGRRPRPPRGSPVSGRCTSAAGSCSPPVAGHWRVFSRSSGSGSAPGSGPAGSG